MNVHQIRSVVRKNYKKNRCDLVIIDYLQLINPSESKSVREQQISEISRELKLMTVEFGIPIIALSQLSRATESRTDHRPMLSDLRESGAIEQDADIVMFLYRDEYYHPDSDRKNIGEVIIAKKRHGETGSVELVWLGEIQKFADKSREM